MSWAEVNQKKGMNWGGMPHDEILLKLEETDPELIADVRGTDPFYDIENDYDQYVRSEIIDRTPNDTFLESDHPRRDPALPRSMLNLRYAGGRGPNDYRLPQHPELFLGFTGNDPRGRDTQPRLDKLRAQTTARAREREVRMGHNVGHGDFIEAERPWTGPALEYDKKEIQRRLKHYWHWFPAQKVGRPWGRNTVADEYYGLRQRRDVVADGDEGLYVPEQDQPGAAGPFGAYRHQASGYEPVSGAFTDGVRRVDRPRDAETAPWRNVTGDADLAVQKYGGTPLGGRGTLGPRATGGGLAPQTQADQDFGQHAQGRPSNRRMVAEGMGAAAAHRRALARRADGDTEHGRSVEVRTLGRSAPELARDIAAVAKEGVPDQPARAPGTVQDDEGGRLGGGAGLQPPSDRQAALQSVRPDHVQSANARLNSAEAIVRGLREGTAAELRAVQGQVVASGKMGTATGEVDMAAAGGGLVPGGDYGAVAAATEAPLVRAAAAEGLEVHHYRAFVPGDPFDSVAAARGGGFASAGTPMPGRREGRSARPGFRSHTQDFTTLGADADRVFGSDAETFSRGLAVGEKNLRATTLGDRGDDVMSVRGEFDGLGDGDGYQSLIGLQA